MATLLTICRFSSLSGVGRHLCFSPGFSVLFELWNNLVFIQITLHSFIYLCLGLPRCLLKGHCIEFKYYAEGIHSGLTPPGNNS